MGSKVSQALLVLRRATGPRERRFFASSLDFPRRGKSALEPRPALLKYSLSVVLGRDTCREKSPLAAICVKGTHHLILLELSDVSQELSRAPRQLKIEELFRPGKPKPTVIDGTVVKIEINQELIAHSCLLSHGFEIGNGLAIDADRDGLF